MNRTIAGSIRRFFPFVGLLAVVAFIGLSGCQKKAPDTPQGDVPAQPAAPAAPAAQTPPPDKVIATVNGTNIMESQVQRRINVLYKPVLAKLTEQSPQMAAQQEQMLRQNLANEMVTEALLEEQARQAKIEVTDEELKAEMTKQLAAQETPMTIEQYQTIVEAQGGDFPAMKEHLRQRMRYHKLLETKFAGELTVAEADAKKYYDDNGHQFQTPDQVRASHILISVRPTDPNADPNQVKVQAKQNAEKLLADVKGGADFAALAKEHSSCPSAAQGGDLGFFQQDQMVKPFAEAAFGLLPGEISELVETQFGYHIIKVTERRDASQIPFDEAKADIIEQLTEQKRMEAIRKYIDSLRQNAKIVYPGVAAPEPTTPAASAPAPQPTAPVPTDANSKQ